MKNVERKLKVSNYYPKEDKKQKFILKINTTWQSFSLIKN